MEMVNIIKSKLVTYTVCCTWKLGTIGRSKLNSKGVSSLTLALALSTPAISPAMETWNRDMIINNWHEQSVLQSVAVRRSTGNVSGHYFLHYFFILFFSPGLPPLFPVSPSSPFLIEGVLGSKNLFSQR